MDKLDMSQCTLFEDNIGALELAREPCYWPCTKHIAIKYHHLREHIKSWQIKMSPIDNQEQVADQFTNGLPTSPFEYLRCKLFGWLVD